MNCYHCKREITLDDFTLTRISYPNCENHPNFPERLKNGGLHDKYFCSASCVALHVVASFGSIFKEHHPELLCWMPMIEDFYKDIVKSLMDSNENRNRS